MDETYLKQSLVPWLMRCDDFGYLHLVDAGEKIPVPFATYDTDVLPRHLLAPEDYEYVQNLHAEIKNFLPTFLQQSIGPEGPTDRQLPLLGALIISCCICKSIVLLCHLFTCHNYYHAPEAPDCGSFSQLLDPKSSTDLALLLACINYITLTDTFDCPETTFALHRLDVVFKLLTKALDGLFGCGNLEVLNLRKALYAFLLQRRQPGRVRFYTVWEAFERVAIEFAGREGLWEKNRPQNANHAQVPLPLKATLQPHVPQRRPRETFPSRWRRSSGASQPAPSATGTRARAARRNTRAAT